MSLSLRYMHLADIPQVAAIDRVSFSPPWPANSFAYEISQAQYSHMLTLELRQPRKGLIRLISNSSYQKVVGYGGLWKIVDEAHISTIATHPEHRGQGYGEILLAGMIRRSITLNAGYIILEVRAGNVAAQKLYNKYEFELIDVKKGYYKDEDAHLMRLDLDDNPSMIDRFNQRYAAIMGDVIDTYTDTVNPRHKQAVSE